MKRYKTEIEELKELLEKIDTNTIRASAKDVFEFEELLKSEVLKIIYQQEYEIDEIYFILEKYLDIEVARYELL